MVQLAQRAPDSSASSARPSSDSIATARALPFHAVRAAVQDPRQRRLLLRAGIGLLVAAGLLVALFGALVGQSSVAAPIELPLTDQNGLPATSAVAPIGPNAALTAPTAPTPAAGPQAHPLLAQSPDAVTDLAARSAPPPIVVHIAGAVRSPGVYAMQPGARAADVVFAAGGLTDDADQDRVNLATPMVDGARLFIPRSGTDVPVLDSGPVLVAPALPASQTSGTESGASLATPALINLNTATLEQLDSLPGVGPATAAAITEHRTKIGRFTALSQLLDVPGIGDAKLAVISKRLTITP
jgi:competence protein ComEA